jgi:DNA-directed RNA polymerase specialized sigma24 family protein
VTGFDKASGLLSWLHPDPSSAAQEFHRLHAKLTFYFTHGKCPDPENLAAEVLTRAHIRCSEGVVIDPGIEQYCLGIARKLKQEQWRENARAAEVPLDPDALPLQAAGRPEIAWNKRIHVRQLFAKLRPEDRRLLYRFFFEDNEGLEEELDLTREGLRTRIHRILERLRAVVDDGRPGNGKPDRRSSRRPDNKAR